MTALPAEPAPPELASEALVAGYEPGLPILRGASVTVGRGEIVALLGPNGAGKSTLVKAIAGLVPVTAGRTLLAGRDITAAPAHRMIGLGLAFVPQTNNVFARMTVEDNLLLAAQAALRSRRDRAERIGRVFATFPDLARLRRLAAGRLSGGQRQMLAIGRALIVGPRVLLLDEPSAGLSPRLVTQVFAKLAEIRDTGVAILLVEQNAKAALGLADRACVLAEGQVRLEGPAAALDGNPLVAALFLGDRADRPA